jgi:hypothetical protein
LSDVTECKWRFAYPLCCRFLHIECCFTPRKYPETFLERNKFGSTVLHRAVDDSRQDRAAANAKVNYFCDRYSEFLLMINSTGCNPLSSYLCNCGKLDLETISIMVKTEKTIVTEICRDPVHNKKRLPLHMLLTYNTFTSNVSVAADCFRYLLHLYPATAGIKDGTDLSPYEYLLFTVAFEC